MIPWIIFGSFVLVGGAVGLYMYYLKRKTAGLALGIAFQEARKVEAEAQERVKSFIHDGRENLRKALDKEQEKRRKAASKPDAFSDALRNLGVRGKKDDKPPSAS